MLTIGYCHISVMIFYVLVSALLALILYQIKRKGQKIPPGLKNIPIEKGLPILGVLNKIENHMCNYLFKLSQKYGPIYQIKFGMRQIVVLNNFEFIKAALVDNGDALSGRWKALKHIYVTYNSGLVFIDGDNWAKQRQFVTKTLKDFGMGRSRSAEIVQEECIHFLNDLNSLIEKNVDFSHFMSVYTLNVISKIIMSKRYTHEDPDYQIMDKITVFLTNKKDLVSIFLLMFPLLENEWVMQFIIWISLRKRLVDNGQKIIEREIKDHLNNLNFNSEGEDLIDRFLITQHQLQEKNGDIDSFTDYQLSKNVIDLLVAGYDTTASTLVWSFMFMAIYPEIQDKVHKEIIDNIGHERLPKMSDKISLNYTQAVMDEILRLSSPVPLSIIHRTLNDVNVKGYFIPKDTVVIPNIFACHLDPNIWDKPFEFYPDHFVSQYNNGSVKYKSREELIAFSLGRRQCIGESLARMEYFIFFTSIFQKFQVSLAKEGIKDQSFDIFNSNDGFIRTTKIKDFIFKSRL